MHDAQGVRGSSPLRPTTSPYSNFGEEKSKSKGSLYAASTMCPSRTWTLAEHCRVKEPPRPVPGTPVGGGAADREPDRKVHDLLPVVETPVEDPLA